MERKETNNLSHINEEYEEIFGITERPNIFSPDDEEYQTLRQKIVSSPHEYPIDNRLPFDGVRLLSADEFKRYEIAKKAEDEKRVKT